MRVPIVIPVPVEHYECLAALAVAFLEVLREFPDESEGSKLTLESLTEWEWWDAQQRERGLI